MSSKIEFQLFYHIFCCGAILLNLLQNVKGNMYFKNHDKTIYMVSNEGRAILKINVASQFHSTTAKVLCKSAYKNRK